MKETLATIIGEFQDWEIPVPSLRAYTTPTLPKEVRKAHVLMGMRRTGKTWFLFQQMHLLLRQKWKQEQILYINFEDDRLLSFQLRDFQTLLETYWYLYPEYVKSEKVAFFFDEIAIIPGWEKFIRRLLDQEKMQVYVTGSSAKMLSKEMGTTLRGRALAQEVFPLSFGEYLSFHGVDVEKKQTPKQKSILASYADRYLIFGGFPESLFLETELHSSLLQDYMNTVLFRDVVERYRLSNSHVVKTFLFHCLRQIAAPLSLTKMYRTLHSQGVRIGKNSLYEYLAYFEDAYALFPVPIFHLSERVRQMNPKKLYAVDCGIITAYSVQTSFDWGRCLENGVYLALRRKYQNIYYYKTKTGKEVDFLVMTEKGEVLLVQVCLRLADGKTREREIRALREAMEEFGRKKGYIVTKEDEEEWEEEGTTIVCLPFWKWVLE